MTRLDEIRARFKQAKVRPPTGQDPFVKIMIRHSDAAYLFDCLAALEKVADFATHRATCWCMPEGHGRTDLPCDCGFMTALAALEETK